MERSPPTASFWPEGSVVFHRIQDSPSVAPRGAHGRATRGSSAAARLLCALLGGLAAFSACTLSDDFNPVSVDQLANLGADAGSGPLACPGGAECCASVPCGEGQRCREGACEAGPVEVVSGADAGGGCRGSDCPLPEN